MYLNHIETLLPEYEYSYEDSIPYFKSWVDKNGEAFSSKAMRILEGAGIKKRHTIAPSEVLFSKRTIEEVNGLYREKAIELGRQIMRNALAASNTDVKDIDCLITTSCTGFMIPSVNAYIANDLGMRSDVRHMPITEVGCTAGATALIYAYDYLKAYPKNKVAIINLEFPSNTIQLDDFSWDNVVGSALFGDGVSCAIVSNEKGPIEIKDVLSFHLPETIDLLGYNLTNSGLKMNLSKKLPDTIEAVFTPVVSDFLAKNKIEMKDIGSYLVHPGGVKILDKIEESLKQFGKDTSVSRDVMKMHGNLSSATLLFIVKEYLDRNKDTDENLIMLSFGPGFSAHTLLATKTKE
jgi:predicted naringenin-chalcone synthase